MNYSQKELLEEGFWGKFAAPFKAIGGLAGAAVKGTAKALDYVAPEITQPLHRFEAGVRDIAGATKKGWDVGYGGLVKEYGDILLDAGYLIDPDIEVVNSGKNKVVVGYRIIGKDKKTRKPIPDKKKPLSFLFDRSGNFKIITTSTQDTSRMNQTRPKKHKSVKKTH